ncbi:hypothetical protein HELRODRAFT_87168, partial [Helobdella robusta]|uniref:Oxysterol-binding protein n=1 Tax=Helobdella robusta TaxID=6412 RepID=T1G6M7_HELRO
RRTRITERPNVSQSLWTIIKNNIGKDITKISMPVNFSEPLSFLQRLTEDLEYSVCLDRAVTCDDPWERMAWVAAFTISSYSTTVSRLCYKPFNPLLGETFECDRVSEMGWRSLAEQVSHHPPVVAMHAQSRDWIMWQEFSMSCKFRGKYIEVVPLGELRIAHLKIDKYQDLYTWRKVSTTIHNVIVGYLWVENHGEMEILNHHNGGKCVINYLPYSYFSNGPLRRVTGVVYDNLGKAKFILSGTWSDKVEGAAVTNNNITDTNKVLFETDRPKLLWQCNKPHPDLSKCYNFTEFAITLNEMEAGVAPTDSRRRPDQRLMEDARWEDANRVKVKLEEKQRAARRQLEIEATNQSQTLTNSDKPAYQPKWFKKEKDVTNEGQMHVYNGEYWACKSTSDWSRCPDIYTIHED